jgi:hypothetical protein
VRREDEGLTIKVPVSVLLGHVQFGNLSPLVNLDDLDHFSFAASLLLLGYHSKEGLQFAIRRESDVLDLGGRLGDRRTGLDGERAVVERESLRECTLRLRREGFLRVDEVHAVAACRSAPAWSVVNSESAFLPPEQGLTCLWRDVLMPGNVRS